MQQGDDQDKSEQATPYKLAQARKKGQVAKSMEVNSLVGLIVFAVIAFAFMDNTLTQLTLEIKRLLIGSGQLQVNMHSFSEISLELIAKVVTLFAPLLIGIVIFGIAVTLMQTKPVFTTEPLKPDFKKLNPVSGFKRLFSIRALFELVKSSLKIGVVSLIIFWGIDWLIDDLIASQSVHANQMSQYWGDKMLQVIVVMILVLLPFALFDLIFSKREYAKKMRMSKREVKEEIKRRDGDPHIKQKRRQIQKELYQRTSAISNVKDSDVIITNPTHFAVALKYDPKTMVAPKVVAKGTDLLADEIRREALKHNVPILRKPQLARTLFKECKIEHPIREVDYAEVVPIFRWVFDLKGKQY